MTYITTTEVRQASGAPSSLIADAVITHAISVVEDLTAKKMNTKFAPTLKIDIQDGTGTDRFITERNPLLKVVALKSDGTSVTTSNLETYRESGLIILSSDNTEDLFVEKHGSIVCKYYYGYVIQDEDTRTTSTAATSAGDTTMTVSDGSVFTANDWIEIEGMDGYREACKITNIATNTLTLDSTTYDHESGSIVTKLTIPTYIKRFMELEAGLYIAINAIGATYTFNASYSIGDLSVVKGVPYTHWRESVEKMIKEREGLRQYIKPRFSMG